MDTSTENFPHANDIKNNKKNQSRFIISDNLIENVNLPISQYQSLIKIADLAAQPQAIEKFYHSLHKEIQSFLNVNNLCIFLLTENQIEFNCEYASNTGKEAFSGNSFNKNLFDLALYRQSPLLLTNQLLYSYNQNGKIVKQKFPITGLNETDVDASLIITPLFRHNECIGMVSIEFSQNVNIYPNQILALIGFISHQIEVVIIRHHLEKKVLESHDALEHVINQRTKNLQAANLNLQMQIEERRKAEAQLYHDAHHDALTGLPNRAMFSDRLTFAIRQLKRHQSRHFAVLFIDLDRFKMINDTLGHHAGDLFLREIACRLRECVRDNDILARLGGDEFVILLDSMQSVDDIEEIASRIITSIATPYVLEGHKLYSNGSIGIAQSRLSYKDSNEILRDADAAMYQAKSLGRGRYVFFDDSMREKLIANMTLEQELRQGIKHKQFELHYQQISDLTSSDTLGFEALLRWNHPSKGLLTPSEFLYMAEETGMILDIETWAIKEVCSQLVQWKKTSQYEHAYISVNLSGRHLTQANQLSKLIELISLNTIEPERLIFEFNEAAFSLHSELALKGLKKLKEFGVKLALDDYGSGISSFNFLHNYPFEFIKLDRRFVNTLNFNEKNISLVKALHELGNNFGYRLVAEGIETQDMLIKLQQVGCEFGQGYHISRPTKMNPKIEPAKGIPIKIVNA